MTGNHIVKKLAVFLIIVGILTFYLLKRADSTFQYDSEVLAIAPIVAEIKDVENHSGYGLGWIKSLDEPELDVFSVLEHQSDLGYKYSSYHSQVGLQGHIYRVVASFLPTPKVIPLLNGVCCFLFAIVLTAIVYQLYLKYDLLFALTFGAVSLASHWVVDYARNLFWVEFTWYLPMLLGLLCFRYEKNRKYLYPMFFLAILVKCLCGYEYLTTVMMSGIMFFLAEWVYNRQKRKEIIKTVFFIGIFSVAGFLCAYLLHGYVVGSGNILDGMKHLQYDLVGRRTFGSAVDYDPVYASSLNASVFDVLEKYFWSENPPWDGIKMTLIGVATMMAMFVQRVFLKKDNKQEISLFIATLLTTLSWLILGKAHSYIHTHMNFVLFYMGWVQSCAYILLKTALQIAGYNKKGIKVS